MTSRDAIQLKIREARQHIALVKKYQQYQQKELEMDETLRGAVQHYLYTASQAAIDLGEMYIEHAQFRAPTTYADIFDVLLEREIINPDLTKSMRNMAGFRNILAHQYGKVQFDIVYTVLTKNIARIDEFITHIEKAL